MSQKETNKLYKVSLKGMKGSCVETAYGEAYVIAKDPTSAYEKLRNYVDKRKLGVSGDRELDCVCLLAEESDYPACLTQLFT